jgi:RNA polymerase sigma-70 factor, ECF subfamily
MDSIASTEGIDASTPESAALKKALASIGGQYREPLVLQVLGGFSCNEISSILEISTSAVMTRVFRARKQLRAILEESGNGKVSHG